MAKKLIIIMHCGDFVMQNCPGFANIFAVG